MRGTLSVLFLVAAVAFVTNHAAGCFHTAPLKKDPLHGKGLVPNEARCTAYNSAPWFRRWSSAPKTLMPCYATTSNEHFTEVAAPSSETANVINKFIWSVKESLKKKSFLSLTLRGPSVPKKGNRKDEKERLRGCIRRVQGRLIVLDSKTKRGKTDQVYLQATIKFHGATDVAQNWIVDEDLTDVEQGLSSIMLPSLNDGNVLLSEWGERGIYPSGSKFGIQGGELTSSQGTWELDVSYRGGSNSKTRLWKRKKHSTVLPTDTVMSATRHDRTKNVPIATTALFLQALGLTKPDGKPRPTMSSKLRQCNKFVEIVGGLIDKSLAKHEEVQLISTVDNGCGRGYLTFSLHSHLMNKYGSDGLTVQSRGIDIRPKLVKEISGIARSLGPEFAQLTFEEGTIEGSLSSDDHQSKNNSLDVLIALHACDTATDDALWSGIKRNSDVLVVAPCCHKEARHQLDQHVAKVGKDHPLADVLRHNIYRERVAETVTDSIRALLLEIAGYSVQVFEFIGGEHTSKNVMITAAKRQQDLTLAELSELRQRLQALSALHGIKKQRLAEWTGEKLSDRGVNIETKISSKNMPPL